jgi:hypothetical protein
MKTTPFVLTSQQLAQLTQSGILKIAATPAATPLAPAPASNPRLVSTAYPASSLPPLVIKSEPSVHLSSASVFQSSSDVSGLISAWVDFSRVTRFGEFSPIRWLFNLGGFS